MNRASQEACAESARGEGEGPLFVLVGSGLVKGIISRGSGHRSAFWALARDETLNTWELRKESKSAYGAVIASRGCEGGCHSIVHSV